MGKTKVALTVIYANQCSAGIQTIHWMANSYALQVSVLKLCHLTNQLSHRDHLPSGAVISFVILHKRFGGWRPFGYINEHLSEIQTFIKYGNHRTFFLWYQRWNQTNHSNWMDGTPSYYSLPGKAHMGFHT